MKVLFFLSTMLLLTWSLPAIVHIRHRHKYSFMFATRPISGQKSLQTRSTVSTDTKEKKIHGDCYKQISNTSLFRGFLQVFYTYDSKVSACSVAYGVTVRRNAPNVFSSLEVEDEHHSLYSKGSRTGLPNNKQYVVPVISCAMMVPGVLGLLNRRSIEEWTD
uniref:Secreted protein n=1 Tax=Steinernema glaseri TaxID=37863 RepID=A0A1I7ZU96_9BILA